MAFKKGKKFISSDNTFKLLTGKLDKFRSIHVFEESIDTTNFLKQMELSINNWIFNGY